MLFPLSAWTSTTVKPLSAEDTSIAVDAGEYRNVALFILLCLLSKPSRAPDVNRSVKYEGERRNFFQTTLEIPCPYTEPTHG